MVEKIGLDIFANDLLSGELNKLAVKGEQSFKRIDRAQDDFQREVGQSSKKVKHLRTDMNSLAGGNKIFSGLAGAAAGFLSVFAAINFGTSSLDKFEKQAQAEAQVMASLASTNHAAGKSFEELAAKASELQKETTFGDEDTLTAMSQMLTFTNIQNDAFDDSIRLSQDLATKMGGDLKGSVVMVGKALNDPAANLSALTRAGIQFSDEQRDVIKAMQKGGDIAGAQAIILKELENQFGGSAKAAARAAGGGWKQFTNAFGDTQERVGNLLSSLRDKLMPVFEGFNTILNNTVTFLEKNGDWLGIIAAFLGGLLSVIAAITIATKIWTAVQWLLNIAMTANPIGVIIMGIVALIAAIVYAWNKFEGFRKVVYGLWDAFKAVFTGIKDLVKGTMSGVADIIAGALTFDTDRMERGLNALGSSFSAYGKGIADAYSEGAKKGVRKEGEEEEGGFLSAFTGGGAGGGGNGGAGGGVTGSQLGSVVSGGAQAKNINITIDSLIEQFSINTTHIEEGIDNLKDKVQEVLLTAVNDVNLMGS